MLFQSTLPVWAATVFEFQKGEKETISIHAARVGSDLDGGAACHLNLISIHAARVGSDIQFCRR